MFAYELSGCGCPVAISHLPDEKEPLGKLKMNPRDKRCISSLTRMSEVYFRIFPYIFFQITHGHNGKLDHQ